MPLNPHNYKSHSFLGWWRIHCKSYACCCRLCLCVSARLPHLLITPSAHRLSGCKHILQSSSVCHSTSLLRIPQICCSLVLLVLIPCAHKSWEGRPPKRLSSSSSPTRVKGANYIFGECHWRHNKAFSVLEDICCHPPTFLATRLLTSTFSSSGCRRSCPLIGTASILHYNKQDDRQPHYVD